jgi:hypothetical protein
MAEMDDRGTPAASFRRRVGEGFHEWVVGQDRTHDRPLDTRPATVDDANLTEAVPNALYQVCPDKLCDVPRCEGMEVQGIFDRDHHRGLGSGLIRADARFVGIRAMGHHRIARDQATGGGRR